MESNQLTADDMRAMSANPPHATVAVLDFLGFKNHVNTLPHGMVVGHVPLVNSLAQSGDDFLSKAWESISGKHSKEKCRILRFSDTVLIYTNSDTPEATADLILRVHLLFLNAMISALPVRGAISRGELFVDEAESIVVGRALTRAAELEASQQWAGVVVDDSVIAHSAEISKVLIDGGILDEYAKIPFKNPISGKLSVLGWPNGCPLDRSSIEDRLRSSSGQNESSVEEKITNTLAYYDDYCSRNADRIKPLGKEKLAELPNIHPNRFMKIINMESK